jgi:leucyl aminopeptidase (aminopeptidase T)
VPLYGEVAIVPSLEPETKGVIVIDGSTYRGVRPPKETDREPLRVVMKEGRVQDISGDPEQVARLKKLDANHTPPGLELDEVGLVTTSIPDNDAYWTAGRVDNGTHSHNTIHIALGKNFSRDGGLVHGKLHMDMDIRRPTVSLDGLVVIKDGVFVDDVIKQ